MGNYTPGDLRRAFNDPIRFHNELRKFNRQLNSRLYASRYRDQFDVMDADWDNLIILDGCRYDVFEGHHTFSGALWPIISQGGHSNEFMRNTFWGKELHDTVYITANPWSEEIGDDVFFLTRTTYSEDEQGGAARLPEDVAQLAKETFAEYPDKRYIVHFMQPNNPYVGPEARAHRKQLLEKKSILCTEMDTPGSEDVTDVRREVQHLRRALRRGYISRDVMFDVYRENLEIVTEHAKGLIETLGGKTAITADHGDMFGERLPPLYVKEYSHWENVYTDTIRKVPWLLMDSETRREVTAEMPHGREKMADDAVKEHLKSMGYIGD